MKTLTSQTWTDAIVNQLKEVAQEDKKKILSSFFKTAKGEYGEGDVFFGVAVPDSRKVAKQNMHAPLEVIEELLYHPVHECRLCAGLIIVEQYKKAKNEPQLRKDLYGLYLKNATRFNNWDLVDLTAPQVVGIHLLKNADRSVLLRLANSENLWEQRIAMIASFAFIKEKQFDDALQIAQMLSYHKHDLIQKAVGWMLREIGKRDLDTELQFLLHDNQYKQLPRTLLRYAIEKFDEPLRQAFLKGYAEEYMLENR